MARFQSVGLRGLSRMILALLLPIPMAYAYEDGAPPGHAGGFDAATCGACHSDNPINAPDGELRIRGLPRRFTPGRYYEIEIVLRHRQLQSGGLQLAVRDDHGHDGGKLYALSERTTVTSSGKKSFLQHTRGGTQTETLGEIRWKFGWQAPNVRQTLILDLAANAANDDISALGDYIYTQSRRLEPD